MTSSSKGDVQIGSHDIAVHLGGRKLRYVELNKAIEFGMLGEMVVIIIIQWQSHICAAENCIKRSTGEATSHDLYGFTNPMVIK